DRELVEAVGRSEGLGRPMLYGTTRQFLEHFGFRSLEDLPRPDELPVVLQSRSLEMVAEPPAPLGAPAEPTPLSQEATEEALALHLRVPEETVTVPGVEHESFENRIAQLAAAGEGVYEVGDSEAATVPD
ncbi:MAG: SMC-Scp complex subunit ScpB, partial [Candidatus Rokuibacteriota bacterium]